MRDSNPRCHVHDPFVLTSRPVSCHSAFFKLWTFFYERNLSLLSQYGLNYLPKKYVFHVCFCSFYFLCFLLLCFSMCFFVMFSHFYVFLLFSYVSIIQFFCVYDLTSWYFYTSKTGKKQVKWKVKF